MSRARKTSKKPAKNRRKRKNIDNGATKEVAMKKAKPIEKELTFSKIDDDYEDNLIITNYLSQEAANHYRIISKLANEFNCSSKDMKIYNRNYEKSQINTYIEGNIKDKKSGLMYVCGHPGTGKSSIMRVITQEYRDKIKEDEEYSGKLAIFNYNSMIFKRLYDFSTKLIEDIRFQLMGKKSKNLESQLKQTDDVIDLGNRIEKYFIHFKDIHKLVIIDEIDNLSMNESSKNFILFLQSVLKSDTNTTIIGIANSVDLLSKVNFYNSKEMDLVERKWIFQPYSNSDIVKIINKKKDDFCERNNCKADYIDPKALEFASKKVAKISGDIRVVFDFMKSSLGHIAVKYRDFAIRKKRQEDGEGSENTHTDEVKQECDEDESENKENTLPIKNSYRFDPEDPKIDIKLLMDLISSKYGLKCMQVIKNLPSQLIIILKTLIFVFDERNNQNKSFKVSEVYTQHLKTLKKLNLIQTGMSDFWSGLKTLENYGCITYTEGKNPKSGKVALKNDIDELKEGMKEYEVNKSKSKALQKLASKELDIWK